MTTYQNIYNIGYCGGSGGFLFLHFLLLSEKYHTNIFDNINFSSIVAQQWNISNHKLWKNTEVWPDSFKSMNNDSDLGKILFSCNPSVEDFFQKKYLLDNVATWYRNIKDQSWPEITSVDDLINLPTCIYDEVYATLECKNMLSYLRGQANVKSIWVYTDIDSQNELAYYKKAYFYHNYPAKEKIQDLTNYTEIWDSVRVDKNAAFFLSNSDIRIKLQDLVNDPSSLIDCGLIDDVNQKQYNLLSHWKSLHTTEILQKIGIK